MVKCAENGGGSLKNIPSYFDVKHMVAIRKAKKTSEPSISSESGAEDGTLIRSQRLKIVTLLETDARCPRLEY